MITWKLEKRKISDLKPYHKNPRSISKEQMEHLQTSLSKFGIIDKPVITAEGVIIGGHQRLKALKQLKIKEVECYVPDHPLTEKDFEELNIRLNRVQGTFDYDILANLYQVDELLEWGFSDFDLDFALDIDNITEDKEETSKPKLKKKCPSCGHEF